MPDVDAEEAVMDSSNEEEVVENSKVEEESKEEQVDAIETENGEKLVTLSVDTKDEDEEEPIQPSSPVPPPTEPLPLPLPYGTSHNWCPQCLRQGQLHLFSSASSSDPLALTWAEQSFFACGSDHLALIAESHRFLPPASSLPPFIPLTVAVIGSPLSGRTSLARKLAATHHLAYLSLPTLLSSVSEDSHPLHSSLSLLSSPPPTSFLLSLLQHAILDAAANGLRGYVLDGWPKGRAEWEAMEEKGMGVRKVIRLGGGAEEEEMKEVEKRWKLKEEREENSRMKEERMQAANEAANALMEEQKRLEADAAHKAEAADDSEEVDEAESEVLADPEMAEEENSEEAAEEESASPAEEAQQTSQNDSLGTEESSNDVNIITSLTVDSDGSVSLSITEVAIASVNVGKDGSAVVAISPPSSAPPAESLTAVEFTQVDSFALLLSAASKSLTAEEWRAQYPTFADLLVYLTDHRLLSTLTHSAFPTAALDESNTLLSSLSSTHLAYLHAAASSLPFEISSLPLASSYLTSLLSPFFSHCPVCFHTEEALRPLPLTSLLLLYQSTLSYSLCSSDHLTLFLSDLPRFTSAVTFPSDFPTAPSASHLPIQYKGYCPVTLHQFSQQQREFLLVGSSDFAVDYKGNRFHCSSEDVKHTFLRWPDQFIGLHLPSPVPLAPPPPPSSEELLRSGKILPFLSQAIRGPLVGALERVAECRERLLYPGMSVKQSVLMLMSLALQQREKGIENFMDDCSLLSVVKTEAADEALTVRYDEIQKVMRSGTNSMKAHFDSKFKA